MIQQKFTINDTVCMCQQKDQKGETIANVMRVKRYQISENNYKFKTCPPFFINSASTHGIR